MAEFYERERLFRTWYGDDPRAEHYRGHGYEPDSRVAYREILRLRAVIKELEERDNA